uniref:Uncharacterized protein n=1 Tax=viral metagenome TaxID=1070528 RepID=A0A6M3LQB2_9ZZZZ
MTSMPSKAGEEKMEGWDKSSIPRRRLITKELLDACKRLLEALDAEGPCDCGGSSLCAICQAKQAIQKAERN